MDQAVTSRGGASLDVPSSRATTKRRSLNPGLRLAASKPDTLIPKTSNQLSPTHLDPYSPSFSVESAAPSPAFVTTGTIAAHAASHTVKASTHDVDSKAQYANDRRGPKTNGHVATPPLSAGLTERSRSNTPVPSNVDASGRASDESDSENISSLPPKLTFNESEESEPTRRGLPPIELSFHDDPTFSNFLTSFNQNSDAHTLSLKDPAGSRRSMQALANVALMLSEDPPVNTPSSTATVTAPSTVPVTSNDGSVPAPEEAPLPPLPKSSMEATRTSSDDNKGSRSSSESKQPTVSSPSSWGTNPSLSGPRQRLDSNPSAPSTPSRPALPRNDTVDLVSRRLKEALKDVGDRGATAVKLDREFVEVILHSLQGNQNKFADMKGRLDSMKVNPV